MHLMRTKPAGRFSPASLFRPDSLVVTGAETDVGRLIAANLQAGGFKGEIAMAATPAEIPALPFVPDLAVIAAPPDRDLFAALASKGCFAAVVVCSGDAALRG